MGVPDLNFSPPVDEQDEQIEKVVEQDVGVDEEMHDVDEQHTGKNKFS